MPIIIITKEDVERARKAREEILKTDPNFKAFEEELEKLDKETPNKSDQEVK